MSIYTASKILLNEEKPKETKKKKNLQKTEGKEEKTHSQEKRCRQKRNINRRE